jgi:hypothetical protein
VLSVIGIFLVLRVSREVTGKNDQPIPDGEEPVLVE